MRRFAFEDETVGGDGLGVGVGDAVVEAAVDAVTGVGVEGDDELQPAMHTIATSELRREEITKLPLPERRHNKIWTFARGTVMIFG